MRDYATFDGEFDADVGEMLGYLKFDDDGAMWFADFDGAWKYFYHDCDEATARWAFERLGPERFGDTTVTPVSVPQFWAADLPRSFIRCLQDQSMPQLAGRHRHPPARRGAVDDRHVALAVPEQAEASWRSYSFTPPRRHRSARSVPTSAPRAPRRQRGVCTNSEAVQDDAVAVGRRLTQLGRLLIGVGVVPLPGRLDRFELQQHGLGAVPLPLERSRASGRTTAASRRPSPCLPTWRTRPCRPDP